MVKPSEFGDCCSQRYVVGLERFPYRLYFCLHHFRQHGLALIRDGWNVYIDRSDDLLKRY